MHRFTCLLPVGGIQSDWRGLGRVDDTLLFTAKPGERKGFSGKNPLLFPASFASLRQLSIKETPYNQIFSMVISFPNTAPVHRISLAFTLS